MDQLPKFSGENSTQTVESWIGRVDDKSAVYDWTPEEKILAAKRALTLTAKRWLEIQRGMHT